MKRTVIIRFGGIFVLYEQKSQPKMRVLFPNSRSVESPLHDPRLTFRHRDRRGTQVSRIKHQVHPGLNGDPLICVELFGENEMWLKRPRTVEVLPDGLKPVGAPQVDTSVGRLYDLRLSGIKTLRSPNSKYYSAAVPILGGSIFGMRDVPGVWQIGNNKLRLLDVLEWRFQIDRFLTIRLAGSSENEEIGKEQSKEIKLAPRDKGPLELSFTSFETWYAEGHRPTFRILEQITKPPTGPLPQSPEPCLSYPWPKKTGATTPGVYCPNARFSK